MSPTKVSPARFRYSPSARMVARSKSAMGGSYEFGCGWRPVRPTAPVPQAASSQRLPTAANGPASSRAIRTVHVSGSMRWETPTAKNWRSNTTRPAFAQDTRGTGDGLVGSTVAARSRAAEAGGGVDGDGGDVRHEIGGQDPQVAGSPIMSRSAGSAQIRSVRVNVSNPYRIWVVGVVEDVGGFRWAAGQDPGRHVGRLERHLPPGRAHPVADRRHPHHIRGAVDDIVGAVDDVGAGRAAGCRSSPSTATSGS